MKKLLSILLTVLLVVSLAACGSNNNNSNSGASDTSESSYTLRVGATPVPHAEILEFVKPLLAEEGIELEIVELTDYVTPNLALVDGDIDANFFQHVPYMESFAEDRNLDLVNIGAVHVEPLGLYSSTISSIDDLEEGAQITLPNDPTNLGRALLLLENNGLITLNDGVGLEATVFDIGENPLNLEFTEIDAAQAPRTLEDVDASIINTNYALEADLNPIEDALIIEGSESAYANIVTTTPENQDNEYLKILVDILQSEDVREFINENYNGAVVPAF